MKVVAKNETMNYANYQFKPERYSDIDRMIREPLTNPRLQTGTCNTLMIWKA